MLAERDADTESNPTFFSPFFPCFSIRFFNWNWKAIKIKNAKPAGSTGLSFAIVVLLSTISTVTSTTPHCCNVT